MGILSWFKAKDDGAAREAELLMQLMGDKAYPYIFGRSRNLTLSEKERYHALKVRRIIEAKLKIADRLDTATRYLKASGNRTQQQTDE